MERTYQWHNESKVKARFTRSYLVASSITQQANSVKGGASTRTPSPHPLDGCSHHHKLKTPEKDTQPIYHTRSPKRLGLILHAIANDDDFTSKGLHEQTTGCLPIDQSCFALSRLSYHRGNSSSNPHACCSTTSYLEVLTISFASLLVILFALCAIRCYLMLRAANRVTVVAAVAMNVTKKRSPPGLGEDAIAALPKFEYRGTGDECDRWECAICLCAMADGEVARQLPRCVHLFHPGCVDMWLVAHTTCPVCRAEVVVVKPPDDGRCVERTEVEAAPAAPAPEPARLENGERDLEAQ